MNLKRAALLAAGIAAGVWVLPATHGEVQHTAPPAVTSTPGPESEAHRIGVMQREQICARVRQAGGECNVIASDGESGATTAPDPDPADEMARKLQKACDGLPVATGYHCESIDTDGK